MCTDSLDDVIRDGSMLLWGIHSYLAIMIIFLDVFGVGRYFVYVYGNLGEIELVILEVM